MENIWEHDKKNIETWWGEKTKETLENDVEKNMGKRIENDVDRIY